MTEIDRVIQLAGGMQELANLEKVTYQAVQKWKLLGRLPASRATRLEKRFNGKVCRRKLSPHFDWGDAPLRTIRSAPQKRAA